MPYGICHLSIVALRLEPSDKSELVSQVLYGDIFKVTEQRKKWSKIRLAHDSYEGWIDNKQFQVIAKDDYQKLSKAQPILSADLVEFIEDRTNQLYPIPIGSTLNGLSLLNHKHDGHTISEVKPKTELVKTAFLYLNAPYLWGGKTPFGIDCSGFTQMVYKINGYKLLRDASMQATQGEVLSFIEKVNLGIWRFLIMQKAILYMLALL
jgi:cell wall-associated NlpC family hydrolase